MSRVLAGALALAWSLHAAAAEPFAKGLLWSVTKPGVARSWVFGTIHLADPRVLEIPEPVLRALEEARSFAMEAPQLLGQDWRWQDAAQFEDGRRLEPLIGAAAYQQARAALAPRAIPDEVLARMKPWAALANITVAPEGYGAVTLDEKLFALARGRRMEIRVLESLEEQVAVFDGIPLDTQVALLKHTLEHRDWLAGMIEPTVQAWLRRDLAGIHSVNERVTTRFPGMTRHYRLLARHIVDNRSVTMAHRLYLPLRAGRAFAAVGATHLYGARGVLRLIEQQGYRVARAY